MRALPLLLSLVACDRTVAVTMSGRVLDEPYEDANPVADPTLEVRDVQAEVFATAEGGSDGSFEVDVPGGEFFTVLMSADGFVPTSISGTAAAGDFEAGDGALWAMSDQEYDDLVSVWAGCPGAGEDGGVTVGQVLIYTGDEATAYTVTAGTVTLYDADGGTMDGCYLDNDGTPGSTGLETGSTGRFAVFGAPEGASSLLLSFEVGDYVEGPYQWPVWIPGDGVAPLYPAYVEL
jgi:hypothetical protein